MNLLHKGPKHPFCHSEEVKNLLSSTGSENLRFAQDDKNGFVQHAPMISQFSPNP